MKRRQFLRGAAGFGLALPLLPSLHMPTARARARVAGVKRVVFLVTGYGAVYYNWFPSDASRSERPISARAKETSLRSFTGEISTVFQESVWGAPASGGTLADNLMIVDGVDGAYGTGHERHYALNGHPSDEGMLIAPSIDQFIASNPELYEAPPAYRSLHIRNGAADRATRSASSKFETNTGRVVAEPELEEPQQVWQQVFEGITDDGGGPSEEVLAQAQAENRSVIDYVYAELDHLRTNPRLASSDRDRLDAYTQYVRELELGQTQRPAAGCRRPGEPAGDYSDGYEYTRVRTFNDSRRGLDHITNIVHAIRCGLTGVITFDAMPAAESYADLGCTRSDFHSTTHARDMPNSSSAAVRTDADHWSIEESLIVERYDAQLLATLMTGLDVVEDPDTGRTFLDNTLIVVSSSMGSQVDHRGAGCRCCSRAQKT